MQVLQRAKASNTLVGASLDNLRITDLLRPMISQSQYAAAGQSCEVFELEFAVPDGSFALPIGSKVVPFWGYLIGSQILR